MRASFFKSPSDDQKKPDYNNCSICHQRNDVHCHRAAIVTAGRRDHRSNKFFKTMPHSHDSCFNCHWKNQKPAGDDCGGCHKPAATLSWPRWRQNAFQ